MTKEEAIKNIKAHCYFANLIPQAKEALDVAIKALEQERSGSAEITQYRYDCEKLIEENERLKKALEQELKTGHWINKQRLFDSCSAECSSCHKRSNGYMHDNGFTLVSKYYDFCPKCGARMVEPQESEDKE